ncbi:PREDICTED: uncharacterized protein LOC105362013 [Ceratosolen solmsi marchali]|uniref:Uncharacterized protein LOC105362013 n=1 Tax=Ceratosolen solmsi marchali TaxID=326594 RepID=A0AAJ7DV91_9HYME|nr:PREDICTED: uncharacterized protein LOC105362013 [Ceratosolen solmsi marchali]
MRAQSAPTFPNTGSPRLVDVAEVTCSTPGEAKGAERVGGELGTSRERKSLPAARFRLPERLSAISALFTGFLGLIGLDARKIVTRPDTPFYKTDRENDTTA